MRKITYGTNGAPYCPLCGYHHWYPQNICHGPYHQYFSPSGKMQSVELCNCQNCQKKRETDKRKGVIWKEVRGWKR